MALSTEQKINKLEDRIDESMIGSRRIFICDAIDNNIAKETILKLWFLEKSDPGKPILVIINSPGGSTDAGFAIWDQAKMISSPIITLITGLAASMGSVLSLMADKGHRYATPNTRIMIHQPSIHGYIQGQATDLEIQAKEILKLRKHLVKLYSDSTGQSEEKIEENFDRDNWMSVDEAIKFGLLDKVVASYNEIK